MALRGGAGEGAILPGLVEVSAAGGERESCVNDHLTVDSLRRDLGRPEAERALLKLSSIASDRGGVGVDSGGVLKSHQTLRSHHPGSADVQAPRHPVGSADAAVAVRDIGGVVSRVVGPVKKRVKHRQPVAGRKQSVVGESESPTILSVRRSHQTQKEEQNPHNSTHFDS